MARVLDIWRSWSTGRRLMLVGGLALLVAGGALAAYLILKRPADVVNPDAAFHPKQQPKPKPKHTVKPVNWAVYGRDDARTRYLPDTRVKPPFHSSSWNFEAGRLLEFSPIVADGTLYVLDKNAFMYALNDYTGKVKWKHQIGQLNASSPAWDDNRLYAATLEPGQVVAMRARDGHVIWRTPLPGRTESSPVIYGNIVIVGCECGTVYGLYADTGRIKWSLDTAGPVKGGVALDDGIVYFGNYAGEVYAVDAVNGAVKWQSGTQGSSFGRTGSIYSTPAVAFGRVYFGSIDGRVYSFEERTGSLAWSHSTGDWVYPAPAVADTPNSPPSVYSGSKDHHFYALDARDGSVRWEHDVGGIVLGAASVIGDVVYVGVIGPNIGTLGFDVRNGKRVFEHELGEYNPVISDGKRLYLTGTSSIRAFKPYTERELRIKREKRREREQRQRQQRAQSRERGGGGHHSQQGGEGSRKHHQKQRGG
jgi:outer membrane protein assembly factor BamB